MHALVYHGPGEQSWQKKPEPVIACPTDALVAIKKTTICGTDLHIMRGNVASVASGTTLGHEGVGIIVDIGRGVTNFKRGDKVLISCITSCGKCDHCKKGSYGHCRDGGWILGNTIDGCQAECVRIPHADNSLHHVPADADEDAMVMLSDIIPTGLEVGVLEGNVQPGKTVAIVGAGPVGIAAILASKFYSPAEIIAIDLDDNRLAVSKSVGATHLINNKDGTAVEQLMDFSNGEGVDVAIEAIGIPAGWNMCEDMVAAGGNIAMLGVHGKPATLHLERMWQKNFTFTAGLVHTTTIPMLMKGVRKGSLDPTLLISHQFNLNDIEDAYDTFSNAEKHRSLKVILSNNKVQ